MENAFILNPLANYLVIKEALNQKISQTQAVVSCLLLASGNLSPELLYDALWAVDSLLEQISLLQGHLNIKD